MTARNKFRRIATIMAATVITAAPAWAQQSTTYTLRMTAGVEAAQPLSRAQLRTQLLNNLRIQKVGNDTVRARVMMIVSRNGKAERVFISPDFALGGGETRLPASAIPGTEWLPDGAGSGAAFGWFPDWLNRLLGLSTTPQTIDPDSNPDADAYWLKEERRRKAGATGPMTGPGNLTSGPTPGAGVATLSMIVLPVSGSGAATASIGGVSVNLGR